MKSLFPEFIQPMTASVAKEPFDDRDWIFETKLDGYRAIAVIVSAGAARGLEGIIAKRKKSTYQPGRCSPELAEDQVTTATGIHRLWFY
jgi:ATP-dependent DNA ligase